MSGDPVPGALMRAEIAEQPDRWRQFVEEARPEIDRAADLFRDADPQLLHFVARGSSDHAALYGQYLAQTVLGIPSAHSTPSVVTVFDRATRFPPTVQIALSQSGASPDLVAAARAGRLAGARAISITNDQDSPLAAESDVHVGLGVGPERSVAATKSYTTELLALHVLLARVEGLAWEHVEASVDRLASAGDAALQVAGEWAIATGRSLGLEDRALLVGRGYSMASAKEGALKLIETCGMAASGWSSADARHGPIGQLRRGTPVLAFGAGGPGMDSTEDLLTRARAMGARPIVIGDSDVEGVEAVHVPKMADLPAALVPMVEILPVQLLALELSVQIGRDPDRPEGLTKVTETS
jgi:glucosamine--fructose-6-phosphate aminotransferase (isomerizing)